MIALDDGVASARRILLVGADNDALDAIEQRLVRAGHELERVAPWIPSIDLHALGAPDLVVAEIDGSSATADWEILDRIRSADPDVPVVVLGDADDRDTAIAAIRHGAQDYLLKPADFDELESAIHRLTIAAGFDGSEQQRSMLSVEELPVSARPFGGLVGTSPAMQRVARMARRVARARAALLITGETGTGKGHLARAIHEASDRRDGPFVAVQATGLVESLLESELFGHERGAFTGADHRRIGRFEQADRGTLFLDEVGEMPFSVQVKLLRVLQEHAFERVGGNDAVGVDVRIIAATSRDLPVEVEQGRFREDLYYRLNVVRIEMPPLRTRDSDVLVLASTFLSRFAAENAKDIRGFTPSAEARLLGHAWPGNVRELENTIERAVVLCEQTLVDARHLHLEPNVAGTRLAKLADIEREAILATLRTVSSTARAAEVLGISVRTIQYRLKEYGLIGKTRKSWLGESGGAAQPPSKHQH